ncbi:LysM peptidoglycan-binding domain-containing protein [Bacillus marasmi]|uniref:LysM peptidoglycan-binding domain-containing protein n=1 Tax=Bacillus marasmi TaxID=1926279 RepID=UPI00164D42FA|nr:LysM peptidoglycan-binding domain-containing protein [Bacillus marasmi]
MEIRKLKLIPEANGYSLLVYIEQPNAEFSKEFGYDEPQLKPSFRQEINLMVQNKFPNVKVNTVKIIMGTLLVASIPFGNMDAKAAETTQQPSSQTTASTIPYLTYIVKSGDSLSKIAAEFGIKIDQITQINQIKGTTIYIGQTLKLPFVSHNVVTGDTLSQIAKKYNSTVESIKVKNKLTSDVILIGQRLLVPVLNVTGDTGTGTNPLPVPTPTPSPPTPGQVTEPEPTVTPQPTIKLTEYRVVSGDTLSIIAKRFNTTVAAIKTENQLTSDLIRIGQLLKIPGSTTTQAPIVEQNTPSTPVISPEPTPVPINEITEETTSYQVVSGDTLSIIARKFNTSSKEIMTINNLSSDRIYVGQKLIIPLKKDQVVEKDITAPSVPHVYTESIAKADNANSFYVSGKTEANAKVYLTFTDEVQGTFTKQIKANENGEYNTSVDLTSLQDGKITVSTLAEDDSGNKSDVNTVNINKDTMAPTLPNIQINTILNDDNANSFLVSGKTEAKSKVNLTFTDEANGTLTKQIVADEAGNYSLSLDLTSLQDGNITISAQAEDAVGNKSNTNTFTVNKDTIAPGGLDFDLLPTITKKTIENYLISGKSEPNSTIDITVTNQNQSTTETVTADSNGNFAYNPNVSSFSDGEIIITAIPRDQNGNIGDRYEVKVSKDTTVHPVTAVEIENNGKLNKENVKTFALRGLSDEEGSVVTITITDGEKTIVEEALVFNNRFDKPLNLSSLKDGTLRVTITQTDSVGNVSDKVETTIEKDTSIVDPVIFTSKVEKKGTGLFYRIAGKGEPGSTIELMVLGQTGTQEIRQTIQTKSDGTFEYDLNISAITKPFVMINQVDSFGNKTTNSILGITSYVVGSGDTLWGISTRFNVSIDSIKTLNNLKTDILSIGQELKLPAVAGVQSPTISEQEFFNMGYLYFGNSQTYIEGINQTANTINVVSPSYFDLNTDGTLKLTGNFDRQFIVSSQSAGVRVVPFLSNHWDRATGEKALQNREQLSTQIAEAVRIYNLDGVNVDIENVTDEYRDEYTDFVRLLREKIPQHKEVSVAVAANPNGYDNGWHGSYDYAGLAKYSDYLMIMAYDESYPGSTAGPIASIGFVDQSIQYALNNGVAKEQIVVGVGHYGRYWKDGASYGGDGMSNNQIQKALELYNGTVTFDDATKSAKAVFTIKVGDPVLTVSGKPLTAGTYTVWFENSEAIKAKIDLIHQYDVKGLGNWSIGQDNPLIWKDISAWLQSDSTRVSNTPTP